MKMYTVLSLLSASVLCMAELFLSNVYYCIRGDKAATITRTNKYKINKEVLKNRRHGCERCVKLQ